MATDTARSRTGEVARKSLEIKSAGKHAEPFPIMFRSMPAERRRKASGKEQGDAPDNTRRRYAGVTRTRRARAGKSNGGNVRRFRSESANASASHIATADKNGDGTAGASYVFCITRIFNDEPSGVVCECRVFDENPAVVKCKSHKMTPVDVSTGVLCGTYKTIVAKSG